ncbi:hypothetical protein SM124_00260 [Bacillus sp. 31A1R]|uniref:Uncharacterized protein n=1 Tax=Robertmurraya mangrovi TaxID=3098077 RepID=A0ABU5ISP7_9BACI|nr:hypothetical protein [Bacillus sp. 31A1R]MDZ5470167.1 hypothetical protein [Bacillus sp. 31A1R]
MNKLKLLLIIFAIAGQFIGLGMLFINIKAALFIYASYIIFLIILFGVLIRERRKEKEEDDRNDYRNY